MTKRIYANEATCRAGQHVEADGGFTCIPEGTKLKILEDTDGLYVLCQGSDLEEPIMNKRRRSKHYLDGQLNERHEFLGLYIL